jgi:hypothetical protein
MSHPSLAGRSGNKSYFALQVFHGLLSPPLNSNQSYGAGRYNCAFGLEFDFKTESVSTYPGGLLQTPQSCYYHSAAGGPSFTEEDKYYLSFGVTCYPAAAMIKVGGGEFAVNAGTACYLDFGKLILWRIVNCNCTVYE